MTTSFPPDRRSSPGDTIREMMAMHDIDARHLGIALGVDDPEALLRGDVPLTADHAHGLAAMFLGTGAAFWLKREADYRAP